MAQLQYIGARYVPIWYVNSVDGTADWEVNVEYEPLTFVTSQNNHLYLSKKEVPDNIGTPAQNTDYWLDMGVFSGGGSVQHLQDEIDALDLRVDSIEDAITIIQGAITTIQNQISQLTGTATHQVLIVTDSYGTGVNADGQVTPFMDYFESAMGDKLTYLKSNAVSGSGLLGDQYNRTTYYTALTQLKATLDSEQKDLTEITDIIFCGFANDALYTDLTVIPAKMAEIQTYCATTFPNAQVWFAPCGCTAGDPSYNNKVFNVLCWLRFCYNYDINYMSGLDFILHNTNMMSSDKLHPNATGQKNIGNGLASILKGGSIEVFDKATGIIMQSAANVNVHNDTFTIIQTNDRIQLYKSSTAHWSPNSLTLTFNNTFQLTVGHIDYPTVSGNGVDTVSVPAIVLVGGRYYQCSLEVALWGGDVIISGIIVDSQGNNYLTGVCTDIQIPYFTIDVSAYT